MTVKQFIALEPCDDYPEERIREIAGDKAEWSALDIAGLEDIPARDRLWAVLREELIDAAILHEFACRCAEKSLALIENPDPRFVEAVAVKRRWLKGEATDGELAAARSAAWNAAWDAARAAAWDAAWDAVWDAAGAAAWDAVGAAARNAARAAVGAAAGVAARDEQVRMLTVLLGEED
jgi:hypothetical protein